MAANVEQKVALCRWCHNRCRVMVHTENGKLVKVDEDPADPRMAHIMPPPRECTRLPGAREYIYHYERVKFPLKRKGEKGEGKWQKISWDQALDEIASKLSKIKDKYGAESLMITNGTGRTDAWTCRRFLNLFGSPNLVTQGAICFGPQVNVTAALIGWPLQYSYQALPIEPGSKGNPATRCVVFIGHDPSESCRLEWCTLVELRKFGTKVIVIDPRKTKTAEVADVWLQNRPGTDTALLMAMINVIIEEGLYDKDFVEKWCYGFDKLAERAREYSPEKTAEITWVPPAKVKEAARMYATVKPGINIEGMGLEHLENVTEALHAWIALMALTGNIDVEGGNYLPGPVGTMTPGLDLELNEMLPLEQRKKQIGADRFKLLAWPGKELILEQNKKFWGRECRAYALAHYPSVLRTIITGEPYPIRAGITTHSNPMITQGNTKLVYKALKSLDLYVVKDYWLTPSAELADYVLPTACWMERPEVDAVSVSDAKLIGGYAVLPDIVAGEHEYWTDYDFFYQLGKKMGQEEHWPWKNLEEVRDFQLKPLGLTYKKFMEEKNGIFFPANEYRKHEKKGGFGTPTGKVELYSTILEKLGYDPLPRYEESKESPVSAPDLTGEYPLTLITGGRVRPYFHSEHRQIESMRKRHPNPRVQIHPETAQKLGISNGDWIWIETPRGRIRQKSQYFEGIDPRVVHAEHGWWFPELPGEDPWLHGVWESNINVLTDDSPERCNKVTGGWPLKTSLCKVYKVKTY